MTDPRTVLAELVAAIESDGEEKRPDEFLALLVGARAVLAQPPAPLLTDEEMPPLPKPAYRTHPLNPPDAYSDGQVEIYGRAVEAAVRRKFGVA